MRGRIQRVGIALAAFRPPVDVFAEQLRTIREQSFGDWVCAITCDSPIADFADDPRLKPFRGDGRFLWEENPTRLGHKRNFERGIQLLAAKGVDAIACSDQDDLWYPEKLAVCLARLEAAPPLSLVHSDMHILEENGGGSKVLPRTAWDIERRGVANVGPQHLLVRNVVAGCSMLFDAELARRYPVIPDEAEYHDHWYALAASVHGGVHGIARPLYAYRQHRTNVVGVSPYHTLFWVPEGTGLLDVFRKCRRGWSKSEHLARAAVREGIPLDARLRRMYLSRADLGLGVVLMGATHARGDLPLLRACLARGAGKALAAVGWRG